MIQFIFIAELVKILTPYIRKSLLLTLDPFECMFLNSIVVLSLCLIGLTYKVAFQDHNVLHTIRKYKNMTPTQCLFVVLIGIATVIASMVVLTVDKHFNTPLINTTIFKIISIFILLFAGVVVFKEKYDIVQIIGLILVVVGGFLVFHKTDSLIGVKQYK